ncbi:MAG: hypothetical protein KGJ13_06575 [Patescibacteria group bacterium]|nr:hypothetical protein [Patescibacteria group bacterium]
MKILIGLLLGGLLSFGQITQTGSVDFPTDLNLENDPNQIRSSFLGQNPANGELYATNNTAIITIGPDGFARTIPLPSLDEWTVFQKSMNPTLNSTPPYPPTSMDVSPAGLIATSHTLGNPGVPISARGNFDGAVVLTDPADGSHRLLDSGTLFGADRCAFSTDGKTLFVNNSYGGTATYTVVVAIDTASGVVLNAWKFGGSTGAGLKATPNGKMMLVAAARGDYSVTFIETDGSSNSIDIGALSQFAGMFIAPDGTAYIEALNTDRAIETITVDTVAETVTGSTTATFHPYWGTIAGDSAFAYWGGGNYLGYADLGNLQKIQASGMTQTPDLIYGLAAFRKGDGSDRIATLRNGGVDLFSFRLPTTLNAIVNAASSKSGSFAPGSFITIYGENLTTITEMAGLRNSTSLAETSVALDGKPIRLYWAGPNQVNAAIPQNEPTGNHVLTLTAQNGTTLTRTVSIVPQSIAAFMWFPVPGFADPIMTNVFYGLVGNPAWGPSLVQVSPGDTVTFWATGGGVTDPPLDDAVVSQGGLYPLAAKPPVTVCGKPATVAYAGRASGFPSLDQVNFVVPDCPSGANDTTLGNQSYPQALWIR